MQKYNSAGMIRVLDGFEILSMDHFRTSISTETDLEAYGEEEERILADYFCQERCYTAAWPEDAGQEFKSAALGSSAELTDQLSQFKWFVFEHKFHSTTNSSTGQLWTTYDLLHKLLQMNLPFLQAGGLLRRLFKIYLELAVSTSRVERVFLAVKLLDTPLVRSRLDETTDMISVIYTEAARWSAFDVDVAVTIWQSLKTRNISLSAGGRLITKSLARQEADQARSSKAPRHGATRYLAAHDIEDQDSAFARFDLEDEETAFLRAREYDYRELLQQQASEGGNAEL